MSRVINSLVVSALEELSDAMYQRELWLGRMQGMMSSFVECTSRLCEDSGLILLLERDEPVYSPDIDAHLHRLVRVLGRVDSCRDEEEILQDPYLAEARVLARYILGRLRRLGI